MFEAHVLHLLRKYLGEYVHGLSNEALRISVWKGDVVLKDLKLKAEALNSLNLPVITHAGFIGTITLKVPWKSLGKEPVVVLIDRVFILARPSPDKEHLKEEDRERFFKAKLQRIEEAELATLEAATRGSKSGNLPAGNSWLGSLIATIIGNLKITISNVHIRYEDSVSNPGHPFCSGITLAKLAAVTMDENGNETFDTSGALDKLRKSLHLQRFAVYHDSESYPWKLHKKWEDLSPVEWMEIFADGIEAVDGDQTTSSWAINRNYLISPINGVLRYHRLGKLERHNPAIPFEKASLVLSDVLLTVTEAQYYDSIKLLEALSRYRTRVEVSHLRPSIHVSEDPAIWWRYAVQASLQQKKMCHKFSWERIKHLCHLRRRYVQLYAASLQQLIKADSFEIRQIERDLDSKVIVLWRLLAHAKIEYVKSKEVSQQSTLKRSWWSFGWRTPSDDASVSDNTGKSTFAEEKLTKEEWQAINKMFSYEDDEEVTIPGKDMQIMILFLVDISIGKAGARIVSIDQTEILCGRFEQLNVTTKLYHKSISCDVLLKFYGLSAPEGTLAQSVSSEKKVNALAASFVHLPVGENVDWRLSAAIAPCHVTVLIESYERFLSFMKRSNAVSPTVALETATALQVKIEKVTRRAQEQFQLVLEEQSRFALDIDLDAPKLRIPLGNCLNSSNAGQFLLDFGHFTLQTREDEHDERRTLYSRFYISGKDIAAFFKDGNPDIRECSLIQIFNDKASPSSISKDENLFYSLIDRCRMSVIVDQIKAPHPGYPSTRISIQVPSLGIHLSPARYSRIFDLLDIFFGSKEAIEISVGRDIQAGLLPRYPADLASDARILVWKGIGNCLAEWKPCFLILSGLYLYVLESGTSQSYQRCCSMSGRHVFEVSPTSVGGSLFSIAVSFRGTDFQKALESSSTLIIEFRDDAEKTTWLKGLAQASYKASAPAAMDILGEADSGMPKSYLTSNNLRVVDLVINGALLETKLCLYGKLDREMENNPEALILELLASGGKVNLVRSSDDLTAKMKLHSLKIKDNLQARISGSSQYLACSLLRENTGSTSSHCPDSFEELLSKIHSEEEDVYTDALPDFTNIHDQYFHPQTEDIFTNTRLSSDDMEHHIGSLSKDVMDCEKCKAKIKCTTSEIFYEAEDIDCSDFVNVTFVMRYPDSPFYEGVDTLMSIRMSKLDFFCHRPTLVALIEFGLDLSHANSELENRNESHSTLPDSFNDEGRADENGSSIIKGMLGFGKRRVVFHLSMDVDSVSVFLNNEDGSQLAMFVQEKFLLDLKIHPSSISIGGSLGNMKLYDMSLGPDHHWGWLCDIRDQRAESLIKFNFKSYCAEDDDYEGHDYSLSGQLCAVRIVFLYRFVQEIMAYLMELATPHTEEVIKFVDKVGGLEWLIQKYEVDGVASLKLDLSLDTPVIIVPYNTMSKNFMQLDLGQLRVRNSFSWHGGDSKNPSSIHLDHMHAEIHGINMAVGINGLLGKPMIREGQGLEILVCRSLRDVFRKVPTVSVEVKIGLLHCVMLDKEYSIILDCAYTNISEEPKIPPSFRISNFASKDSMRMLVDKVNFNGQALLSGTVAVAVVRIEHALLELCRGIGEESPLAKISLEGLWLSYRYTSLSESDLYVTVPKFSILDIRPDVKSEMRLMLGSFSDVPKLGSSCDPDCPSINVTAIDMDVPNLTMLILDCRWRSSSQSMVMRMQQPHVLVVPDFLLAVVEFFFPSLRAITGTDETSDPKNDPVLRNDNVILLGPIYRQSADVVVLSPKRQLIVDTPGFGEVIYDGCRGTIRLTECEINENSASSLGPQIIIIGRGKRLRFRNVKIENGALLQKYTYLGCDSSYSICQEDGVEISLNDSFSSEDDNKVDQGFIKDKDNPNTYLNAVSNPLCSFSFESQIISPEFTFYDSAKVSIDDSLPIEKLLRAKMDLSFMFAAKESDIWIRSLVKDLTVEAGSGLVVLDPVDISAVYTSVKDKTNISVISTDMYIHLSLSVASLLLQLQQQASLALQFGSGNPVAPCTNFKRVWVSPKDSMPGYNLTFWRPQAPSNYAILGDCVTSRPIPPTQVVLSISNTYGRVRKPLGFKLLGFLSDYHEEGEKERSSSINDECSLWMPLAPPGYTAVGCVAHLGNQPPPIHIVYCIRSDLVTSTSFSDCIFSLPPNPRVLLGFSIWRIDNAAGSFYAHCSHDCPSTTNSVDLHHILLYEPRWDQFHKNKPSAYPTSEYCRSNKVGSEDSANSRWDVVRSYSKPYGSYISTPHFERIWWDRGSDVQRPISIWRPLSRPGFSALGDCLVEGLEPPSLGVLFKCDFSEISARPVQFTKVSYIDRKGLDEAYFWYPVAPPGYVSFGCVVTKTDEEPNKDLFCCPRVDIVGHTNMSEIPISETGSKGSKWSIWKVENQACTFLTRADMKKPSSRLAFAISDQVKQKTRQNMSVEIKLGSFSLTVLDGTYGMVTPLFDLTVVNTNLATHGQLEAINAVLICSIAASTFNRELEAWEPLVEPFDGIFKVETYIANGDSPGRVGKRVRIAATSAVNLNISAGNLETLVESIVSWRSQSDLEQKSMRNIEESGIYKPNVNLGLSALEEDDLRKVILENRLGCGLYLRKVDQNSESVELLQHENHAIICIPPPRFSDRLNVATGSKGGRYYISVRIIEAKELPIVDDGNGHNFFCALRLVVDTNASEIHKLFPQSARTKTAKPFVTMTEGMIKGTAKWNELFLFEIPEKGSATLELEITNLSSKVGKGETIGALSIPIKNGPTTLKRAASVRRLMEYGDNQHVSLFPLKRRGQSSGEDRDQGILLMSTYVFDQNTVWNLRQEVDNSITTDGDVGFWVSSGPMGPWESFGSLLALSVVPKSLDGKHFAFEVFMRNGKRHALLRPLATVINNSDVKLEISVCPASVINRQAEENLRNVFAILNPGSSANLPWSSVSMDSDFCLQIRPSSESPKVQYAWSQTFVSKTACDELIINQGLLSKQSSLKYGNISMSTSAFMLKQLEKKDVLLHCKSSASSDQHFWINATTDASALHTEINLPVYDWRITLTSPLRLENRLPYEAEYVIWEETIEGTSVERRHGFISSGGCAFLHSVDLSRPIYLALSVQGGWVLDQDVIMLMDISAPEHASSFRMIHEESKRRLHVSIERDLGGNIAAPKTIRFFVPYCINNYSGVPISYHIMEIEPLNSGEAESSSLKPVKSAKFALKHTPSFADKRVPSSKKNILQTIAETSSSSIMLSPLDYVSRPSRNELYISQRVGISVAAYHSDHYSPGISLFELENKERIDIKAFASSDTYYRLSVALVVASDRTKVVHFQPHTLFINRIGCNLCLKQLNTDNSEWLSPADSLRFFKWRSSAKTELLMLRMDGYKWSTAFSIETEGVMNVSLKKEIGNELMFVRVDVRSGLKNSHHEVVFRLATSKAPYRIENRSMFLPVHFRQVDGFDDSWQCLLPNSSVSFCWEDLGRRQLLEVLFDRADPSKSAIYNIDDVIDHQPSQLASGPMKAIRITVLKEGNINICRISDWMPENKYFPITKERLFSNNHISKSGSPTVDGELHVVFELADLGLSIIDHMPEEILYFSLQRLVLMYSTGLESGMSRFKLRVCAIQVDNQLPFTPMPVLFRQQRVGNGVDYADHILKISLSMQGNNSLDLNVYPYLDIQGPNDSAFIVNIHEPVIWRLHEMMQQVKLGRIHDSQNSAVSVDPMIQIGHLSISEVRFKVSMAMSPTQRPGGVLGFWLSLMTALGNMENMAVKISKRSCMDVCMRQSALISTAISNVQRDLLSQPLRLLSGVDILGNASSALGHMSKGVAALSMDKKFIQGRQKQESKGVEDIGDVIREGGAALAKGFFRGVTGILTKPLEGAKSSGVEGFVQGVGKGIIGAAAQPVSGVLDLLSKTTEGANAVRMKIASAITSEEQLLRKRLPRAIKGDNLIRPFDEHDATGQAILQLAESGTFFGQVDLFKVRGKFALSDVYEDHFLLPEGKVMLVTHRRVLLLQQPSNIVGQKKVNPARDPCSVLWDVLWEDLVTMELTYAAKDNQRLPPSRLILYLSRMTEMKEHFRVVKCKKEYHQAIEIYNSIEKAINAYGPNRSEETFRKVTKPYSPNGNSASSQVLPTDLYGMASCQEVPDVVPAKSTFGAIIPPEKLRSFNYSSR